MLQRKIVQQGGQALKAKGIEPSIKLGVERVFQNNGGNNKPGSLGRSFPGKVEGAGVTREFGSELLEWRWGC